MKFHLLALPFISLAIAQDSAPDSTALNKSLDSLCSDKAPFIPACSLRQYCTANSTLASDKYCSPGTLLASICSSDKKKDSSCSDFTTKCGSDDLAKANSKYCESFKPIPDYISAKNTGDALSKICSHHPMPSCDTKFCALDSPPDNDGSYSCDQLTQIRTICIEMGTMEECGGWNKMCKSTNNFAPLCQEVKLNGASSKSESSTGSKSSGKTSGSKTYASSLLTSSLLCVALFFL